MIDKVKVYFAFFLLLPSTFLLLAQTEQNESTDENKPANAISKIDVNSSDYWHIHYHKQVTAELFKLTGYPYYPGGADIVRPGKISVGNVSYIEEGSDVQKLEFKSDLLKDISELRKIVSSLETDIKEVKEQDKQKEAEAEKENQSPDNSVKVKSEADEADLAFDAIRTTQIENVIKSRNYLEKCSDLIYKWRSVNESPLFMLEILRSVELTKTDSGVYKAAPDVAVQIKRVLGTISKLNRNFDFTSRVTMEAILVGDYPRAWLSRLEKQLADLQIRATMLIELNDTGSESLGLGKIDRSIDQIPYQRIEFIRIVEPDKYDR